ncbi:Annexin B9 [Rhizophlyctis rosea]|nr:Annexin B9 [Rhizophlyctis rosea]
MSFYPGQQQPQQPYYPQQQQYGQYAPPPGPPGQQYPPPGGYPPPGQQPYGAPPGGAYPPQQHGQYQPPQGPPPGSYPNQTHNQYAPPPGPPQPYAQQSYGAPLGQSPYGAPPPQGPYGAPAQAPYGAPPQGYAAYPGAPPGAGAYPQPPGGTPYGTMTAASFYAMAGPQMSPAELQRDAELLRKAMKGFGTDEKALIEVLCKRTPMQAPQIAQAYKANFGRDLVKDLESETSGNFKRVMTRCAMALPDVDALELHDAIAGLGTNEDALIEILTGRTNAEIWAIKQAYRGRFGKDLENDVKSDTSQYFRKILVALLQGMRDETNSYGDVNGDVEALYRAGVGRMGTDESTFINILASRSENHLRAVFNAYQMKYHENIEKVIKKEFSGDIENALLGVVKSIQNRPHYIAEMFEKAMAGLGTKDNKLIRLTVRHRDPQVMAQVKAAYYSTYGKTLYNRVKGETSGDYERALLAMIGP